MKTETNYITINKNIKQTIIHRQKYQSKPKKNHQKPDRISTNFPRNNLDITKKIPRIHITTHLTFAQRQRNAIENRNSTKKPPIFPRFPRKQTNMADAKGARYSRPLTTGRHANPQITNGGLMSDGGGACHPWGA